MELIKSVKSVRLEVRQSKVGRDYSVVVVEFVDKNGQSYLYENFASTEQQYIIKSLV